MIGVTACKSMNLRIKNSGVFLSGSCDVDRRLLLPPLLLLLLLPLLVVLLLLVCCNVILDGLTGTRLDPVFDKTDPAKTLNIIEGCSVVAVDF